MRKCQNSTIDKPIFLLLSLQKNSEKYMEQLLHKITVEYQKLKKDNTQKEIQLPSIDSNTDITGLNMFIAILFAANRNLKGEYTTFNYIRENEWNIQSNAPIVTFLDYYISNEILFLKDDVYSLLPHFDNAVVDDKNKLEELFIEGKISSFGIKQQQFVEKNLGKTIRVSLEKNILNYKKIEAVPNEYVIGIKAHNNKNLSTEKTIEKEYIESKVYNNFQEAQQQLFYILYTYEKANTHILKPFSLEQLGDFSKLLINSDNNAIIAKEMAKKEEKKSAILKK